MIFLISFSKSKHNDYKITAVGGSLKQLNKKYHSPIQKENFEVISWIERDGLIKIYDESLLVVMPSKYSNGRDLGILSEIIPISIG